MDFDHYPAHPPPPGVTSNFENPVSLAKPLIVVNVLFIALMTLIVFLRIYTKHFIVGQLWWDDCKWNRRYFSISNYADLGKI